MRNTYILYIQYVTTHGRPKGSSDTNIFQVQLSSNLVQINLVKKDTQYNYITIQQNLFFF